jgi:hypothetical protein
MPVHKGKDCVGEEMNRWKAGDLHSGKNGPVVKSRKQALAIAISECNHSERLQSIGYSEETSDVVAAMLDFADMDWKKQFDSGKGPGPEKSDNYHTGLKNLQGRGKLQISKTGVKGQNRTKQEEPEMLSGPALEKGPGNPQGGSSKEVFGLRALG